MSKTIPRLSADELTAIAVETFHGRIFHHNMCETVQDIHAVFMPIGLGALAEWTPEEISNIGLIYEHMSSAGPRSINGMPVFFSMKLVHKDDMPELSSRLDAIKAAVEVAAA